MMHNSYVPKWANKFISICPSMSFNRFTPGCQCCGFTCEVCSDDFNRADSTDVTSGGNCGWVEDLGNWSISSNQLKISTALARIITMTSPFGNQGVVRCKISASSTSAVVRILFNYIDSSNYYFILIAFGASNSGSIQISKRVAGSNTIIDGPYSKTLLANTSYDFMGCFSRGFYFSAFIDSTSADVFTTDTVSINKGEKVGFSTGSSHTGDLFIDDFLWTIVDPDCILCPPQIAATGCVDCKTNTTPENIELIIDNALLSDSCPQYICDGFAGTQIVTHVHGGAYCTYYGDVINQGPDPNCSDDKAYWIVQIGKPTEASGTERGVTIGIMQAGFNMGKWSTIIGFKPMECMFSGVAVPFEWSIAGGLACTAIPSSDIIITAI